MSWSTYFSERICFKPQQAQCLKPYRQIARSKMPEPQSPYLSDRESSSEKQIKGNPEETKWKEVNRGPETSDHLRKENLKKINIL